MINFHYIKCVGIRISGEHQYASDIEWDEKRYYDDLGIKDHVKIIIYKK